ncbi:MAG: aldehyde dehydrogenase family protein [Verrucomicrobia bacterium]|nr:aldehyde dehydrogenase family protein [Verrucomicrobiota bacterium]
MNSRLPVNKTCKLFIGGAFPRTESGRAVAVKSPSNGSVLARVCRASRKDLRDAVTAARKAVDGWAGRSAANRGQILYRMAEMLEQRASELTVELCRSTGAGRFPARREVQTAADRLVWYAGWTDKIAHVYGTVNPVASAHFNFSIPEPTGVVCAIAPDRPALLGLISVMAPVIACGNAVVVLASEKHPLPSVIFAEILATSDLPPGVVNILTGFRHELALQMARHEDVNALVDASGDNTAAQIQAEAACNVKRVALRNLSPSDWVNAAGQNPYWMLDTLEIKTVWHPIGF